MSGTVSTMVSYIPTKVKLGAVSEGVKAVHEGVGNFLAGLFDLITAEETNTTLDNPVGGFTKGAMTFGTGGFTGFSSIPSPPGSRPRWMPGSART